MVGKADCNFLSVYVAQVAHLNLKKERFCDQLQYAVVKVPAYEIFSPVSD